MSTLTAVSTRQWPQTQYVMLNATIQKIVYRLTTLTDSSVSVAQLLTADGLVNQTIKRK